MGGVNDSEAYVNRMGLGYKENGSVTVTNTLLQGGIVSVFYLGTLAGCFLGGYVSDRYGRIKSLGSGAAWGIVGAVLQCTAMNPAWMITSRLVNGIGTGVLNATVPVYGSEVSDYESRGQFIAMEFTLNICGVVVAYWLGFGLSYIDNGTSEFQWRFPIAFQIVMLLILMTGCWAFPESPRWLCMVGRREEALYVLKRLRGSGNERAAILEMGEIEAIVELERESGANITYFHMLFGIGKEDLHIARRVQLVIWLQILQSWSGIAGVTMYAPSKLTLFFTCSMKMLMCVKQYSKLPVSIPKRQCGYLDSTTFSMPSQLYFASLHLIASAVVGPFGGEPQGKQLPCSSREVLPVVDWTTRMKWNLGELGQLPWFIYIRSFLALRGSRFRGFTQQRFSRSRFEPRGMHGALLDGA